VKSALARAFYLSEYNKNVPGSRMTVFSSDYWDGKNQYFATFYFESLKVRDKYYPNATGLSDKAKASWEKMKPLSLEESKYVLESRRVKTEWMLCLNEINAK
jgi:hypothetical protein